MANGIQIKHGWKRNTVQVVENRFHRYGDGGYWCNICPDTKHVGKATHLWLGPGGDCLISPGVFKELERAGDHSMNVIGLTKRPPTLTIGRGGERDMQDNANRAITVFKSVPSFAKAQHSVNQGSKAS